MQVRGCWSPLRRRCYHRPLMLRLLRATLLATFACFAGPAVAGSAPLIVVGPGHGGFQEGAIGADGVAEKTLSLQIALHLKETLERTLGAKVSLTRDADTLLPLSERVAFANRQKPDLF